MFCSNCGKEIQADFKYCRHCGHQIIVNSNLGVNSVLEPEPSSPLNKFQKDAVAKELRIFLRIIGISLIVAFLSAFIIYWANSNNDDYLGYGIDRNALIKRNQMTAVKHGTPKVFIYSIIILTLGRYVLKGFQWAEKRNNDKTAS